MWLVAFSLSSFLSELCNIVTGRPALGTCVLPGSLGYFSASGPVLLNDCPLEKLMLMGGGGSKVCNLLSLVPYLKHVHFVSLKLSVEYCGSGRRTALSRSITIIWIVSH
jgi:hypothetical protein